MRVNKNAEALIILVIYLVTLYFWTLPIQTKQLPYGEVDAASHYAIADYTYTSDRSINELPYYIDWRYGRDNKFKEHVLWYPPPFHTNLAMSSVFYGGDMGIYVMNAILCSLFVLSIYFVMRKLFGFEAAVASSILLIFSVRDIMVYLWGQWPERVAFAFVPLIIYCFYKYVEGYLKGIKKPIYLYVMAAFLATNLFMHPMVFFHSVAALVVISGLFFLKFRKKFFDWKPILITIAIFIIIVSVFPYQTMNAFIRLSTEKAEHADKGDFSRLFYWFKPPKIGQSVPSEYYEYGDMIGPLWTVLFLLIGIGFLLIRRNMKDLVMLGWLFSLYLMIHLDVFGKGRVHRSLSGTSHIFYPLIVLGLIFLVSFVPKQYRKIARSGLLVGLVLVMFSTVGMNAYNRLSTAYSHDLTRVNEYQSDMINWLKTSEIPVDATVYQHGVSYLQGIATMKARWMWMGGAKICCT